MYSSHIADTVMTLSVLIGPGSFYTSLMPILLLEEMAQALRRTPAPMVYIGNLGRELSLPAANLKLENKLAIMERYVGKKVIDAVIVGPKVHGTLRRNRRRTYPQRSDGHLGGDQRHNPRSARR